MTEKTDVNAVAHLEQQPAPTATDIEIDGRNIKQATVASVPLTDALAKDNPSVWSSSMIKLYGLMVIVTLNDCMNGYDGSLMGSINAMKPYHHYFKVGMQGGGTGIVFAIYSVGNLVGAFFAAPASDYFGRRFGMFAGSAFIVLGAIIESTAKEGGLGQFMAGRFFIGFGMTIATTAAPVYLVEMAYPSWRGVFGGLYNVIGYYSGAVICNWTTYGTGFLDSNWSWRIPTIIQAVPSIIVMATVWFMPESPRWLWQNNRMDTARDILVKYHGNGNPDSAVVELECNEMEELINREVEGSDKRWWDYRALFDSRAKLHRIWLLLLVCVFSQFIGGSVISYFMPVMLNQVGITKSSEQLLMNGINTILSFSGGIVGSFTVDRFGRRQLFLWGTFLTGLVYIPINVIASFANGHISVSSGYAFIAMIFLYGIFFSFCWTPLQALYPAEILTNETRAKGMAFQGFASGMAGFINLYATPVALANIGWKTYTVFLVFHFGEWALMYLTLVETKGRSIEELEEIFNDPKPVKKSLQRHKVVVKSGEGVKMELDAS